MRKNATQQAMKERNKALLLHLLYDQGPISRVELARLTGLSPSTVSMLIEESIGDGFVHEIGTVGGKVGRKMKMLDIRPDCAYSIGFDLSNMATRCVLLDVRGHIVASDRLERLAGEEELKAHLPQLIEQFVSRQRVERDSIRWMGISLPGIIDEENGIVRQSNYLGLKQFPLAELASQSAGFPVRLINDLDAQGFAERFSGSAKGMRTIVYMLFDFGVGAGLLINNQIYRGANGQAGSMGPYASYSTGRLAEELKGKHPDLFGGCSDEDAVRKLVELGLKGEAPFGPMLERLTEDIAKYCATALQLINPEQLILNGWLTRCEPYLERLTQRIHHYEASPSGPTPVRASYWNEFGGAVGAASIGLDSFFGYHQIT
ncbi:ROK family transcriptional regulator [Paenibacillus ginsengarvi]|uniref:ROK family transcriptional regulator n=1 Tax=Paenibacillus ginsengarvi TaxID=400777 RepID=A0A3B0BDF1_9BACL|nr:ROK family transcriptional regulator [Paenibacillus ginsengarvi]RKN70116.1 ROK family transcriptional regulator [Paenibacillus ginsengarvi]